MQGPEDDAGLSGKVALISGGGAADDGIGNGRAAAILLARAGTKVMVADRELRLAQRTVEMIVAEGGTAVALGCDVTREADCKALVEACIDGFGRLDLLDNNVGIGSRGSVVEEKPEEYQRVMQINVESMFLLSKYAIPAMIKTAQGIVERHGGKVMVIKKWDERKLAYEVGKQKRGTYIVAFYKGPGASVGAIVPCGQW